MTAYIKYPRTPHLPSSLSTSKDDIFLDSVSNFWGKEVVVSLKMDGENSSLYNDYFHARSLDGRFHPSQSWIKNFHQTIAQDIPEGWRIVGENVYAYHSIYYTDLTTYFYVFAIYNEKNYCLSWEETVAWCELLGLQYVPVLYKGIWSPEKINFYTCQKPFGAYQTPHKDCTCPHEGYVVRVAESFHYDEFSKNVAKFVVRGFADRIKNEKPWHERAVIKNELKSEWDGDCIW